MDRGRVLTYFGDGEGKTSAAIGHAVRALGHGKRVTIIHFMKGREEVGEYQFFKGIKGAEVHLCGHPQFLVGGHFREEHLRRVKEGLRIAGEAVEGRMCDLLVMDEVLYAAMFGLIEDRALVALLDRAIERGIHVVLTGRSPSEEVRKRSDILTQTVKLKHRYDVEKKTIEVIDY